MNSIDAVNLLQSSSRVSYLDIQEAAHCKGVSMLDGCNIVGSVTEVMAVYD